MAAWRPRLPLRSSRAAGPGPLGGTCCHQRQAVGVGETVECGLPCPLDFPCVGLAVGELVGTAVAVLVGDGVDPAVEDGLADLLADGEELGVADVLVPGADDDPGCPGPVPPAPLCEPTVPPTVAWSNGRVPACCGFCFAVAGACGAAHCVKGACGPPVIATTTATRQAAIAAIEPNPANRRI